MYCPKPAYTGLRSAITSYFGAAFVVRDAEGQEVLRFAENGVVLLMKQGAQVHTGWTNWLDPDIFYGRPRFIVRNSEANYVAVVPANGHLYLAGDVMPGQSSPLEPGEGHVAFEIKRGADNAVVSLIDDEGNLKMTRCLIVEGIAYDWLAGGYMDSDHCFAETVPF